MKTSRFSIWLAWLLLGFVGSVPLHAQQKPKENAQVLVGVVIAGVDVPTSEHLYFTLKDGGTIVRDSDTMGLGTGTTYRTLAPVLMSPNRHYQAWLSSGSWQYGDVKFTPPPGYTIWINDRPTPTCRVVGNPWLIYKIELRADQDASFLPAGEAVAPRVADLVWSISAGRYSNGLSAGSVQWRASGLSTDLLNATSLQYLEPGSAEVEVTRHSDGGLLELRTWQFLLYVKRNSTAGTGYDIEIYSHYADRTGSGDGPYTYDESPIRTYRISNPNGSTWNGSIKIEKIEDTTKTWNLSQSGSDWTVVETSTLRTITLTSTGSAPRVETVVVKDNANVVASKLQRSFQTFSGWGQEEMTEEVANPDASNGPALTTTYTYNTTSGTGGFGRLQSVTHPDGSWAHFVYDDSSAGFGNLSAIYRPWQESSGVSASNASASNSLATLYSYAGERNLFNELPAGTETKVNGTTTGKTTVSYAFPGNAANGWPLRTETVQTYTAASTYLTTTRQLYNPTDGSTDFIGRLYTQTNPDGTKVSALRYQGTWWNYGDNDATDLHGTGAVWGEYRFSGFATQVQDSVAVSSWDSKGFSTVYMVPNRSNVELAIYDAEGRVKYTVRYVFTSASSGVPTFKLLRMDEQLYTDGVPTLKYGTDNSKDQLWLYDGKLFGHTYNDGSYVEYTRDALGRDYLVRKWNHDAAGEYPAQAMIYTHKTFDAAGRTLSEKVSSSSSASSNPSDAVTTTRQFNVAGLMTTETAESGAGAYATTFAYTNGGRTVTATLPTGSTKITEAWLDGSPKSVTGTGAVNEYHNRTVNGDGTVTKTSYILRASDLSSPTSAPRWSKVTTDWAGRTIKEERPAPSSGTFTRQYYYNSVGQIEKVTEPGLADTLTAYNAWQQPYRSGLDVGANGTLDLSSNDRITESDSIYEVDGGGTWWLKTTTTTYNQASNSTGVTTGIVKQRQNKFDATSYVYVQSETIAVDLFGNQTSKVVKVQRGTSTYDTSVRLVTETTTYPDSTSAEITTTRNGLLQKKQTKEGLTTRFYYDAVGRLLKQTDPRTDTSTTARLGYVTNSNRLSWRQDSAGNQTNFGYDSAGRPTSTTDPLSKVAYQSYNARGQVTRTWGATAYPVEYGFSDYGETTTQSTFRDGSGWTGSTWPSSPGTADTTTWAYEAATGLLTSKTDAASRAVSYTYNSRGALATRTWSRGTTSTYSYSSTTAEQTGIDYSDSTPDLTYTYNRSGQTATVADVTGTRTFAYSTTKLQLSSETLPSYFDARVLSRTYDTTTTGALGRTTGFALSGASGSGTDTSVSYGYDSYGRFNSVASSPATFTYSYTSNSNLIASISETSGWSETMAYESNRDLVSSIEGKFSTTTKAKFAYTHDNLGRRTSVIDTGEMFSRYVSSGLMTAYSYNDRSEVTGAQTFNSTSTSDASYPLAGRGYAYAFDNIGSRTSSAVIGATTSDIHSTTYTNNNLNQVTARSAPASADVTGLAPASATITVNSSAAARQGDYYYKNVTSGSTPSLLTLIVASSLGGSTTRYSYLAATPESFTYDHDGNVTDDGRWQYTWDAENRLVSMETSIAAYTVGVPRQFLTFKYDYLGRRVRKTVANWNGSAYVAAVDRKFIYDGWNLIGEYSVGSTSSTLATSFTWGLDLSRTLQDGGGVCGLLIEKDASSGILHLPLYDANGNVHALINRSDGSITAAYEYSAFGETVRATGSYAASNAFRFSTKYTDQETQQLYYGRRYYNPSLGRWLGRDPIEEKGGLHLYGFCQNNSINRWDVLGKWPTPFHQSSVYISMINAVDQNGTYIFTDKLDLIAAVQSANRAQDGWFNLNAAAGNPYYGLPAYMATWLRTSFDAGGQGSANSFTHFMRASGEDPVEALGKIDTLTRTLVAIAQKSFGVDDSAFANAVGKLTHLFQDATSPEHVDPITGQLKEWDPYDLLGDWDHKKGEANMSEEQKKYLLAATRFAVDLATGQATLGDGNIAAQLFDKIGNSIARDGIIRIFQENYDRLKRTAGLYGDGYSNNLDPTWVSVGYFGQEPEKKTID